MKTKTILLTLTTLFAAAESGDAQTAPNDKKVLVAYFSQSVNHLFSIQQTYYDNLAQTHGRASECIGCRKCERSCPQHLPIVDDLKRVAATFETAG